MIDNQQVRACFTALQEQLCAAFSELDGGRRFIEDIWERPGGGGGCSRNLSGGGLFEKAGVNFSHIFGDKLPAAATKAHPALAGEDFEALGISVVVHPMNPYVPTAHCNLRFFVSGRSRDNPVWWFGGGYDLTPCYPFAEDAVAWHRAAHAVCRDFGDDVYPRFKQWCDDYFYIRHRNETRGIGGLFFDDLNAWGFERCFEFVRRVGDSFFPTYAAIVSKRADTPYGEREKSFQQYRRGRYVEFNLVYDRGTLFGLQSEGRIESVLMSLPPQAAWCYNWKPEAGSSEEDLYLNYLKPRDWLNYR